MKKKKYAVKLSVLVQWLCNPLQEKAMVNQECECNVKARGLNAAELQKFSGGKARGVT